MTKNLHETPPLSNMLKFTDCGLLYFEESENLDRAIPENLISTLNSFLPPDWDESYLNPQENDLGYGDPQQGLLQGPYTNTLLSGIDGNRLAYLLMLPYLIDDGSDFQQDVIKQHVQAHFQLSALMIDKMCNPNSNVDAIFAAKFSLYILVPIMRLYEIPLEIEQLEDAAFKILDPNGYEFALKLWKKEISDERYTIGDLENIGNLLEELVAPLGNEFPVISISLRQKSLLSFYRKFRSRRDYKKDAIATTVVLDLRSENRFRSSKYIASFVDAFSKQLGLGGYSLEESENYYEKPRNDDQHYRAIDCVIQREEDVLNKKFEVLPGKLEMRFTTLGDYERANRTHVWYKQVVQSLQNIRLKEGVNNKAGNVTSIYDDDFNLLADIARAHLYAGFDGEDIPYIYSFEGGRMLFDGSNDLFERLIDVCKTRIPLATPRGKRVLWSKQAIIDDDPETHYDSSVNELNVIQVLNTFSQSINPEIANKFSPAFEIRRIETFADNKPQVITYQVIDLGKDQYVVFRSSIDGVEMNEQVTSTFTLRPFDQIRVLVESEGEFQPLVTVGEILDILSSARVMDIELERIHRRYKPVQNELIEWRNRLDEINTEMAISHADKKPVLKRYKDLIDEVRLAVSLYDSIQIAHKKDVDVNLPNNYRYLGIKKLFKDISNSGHLYLIERLGVFLQEVPKGEARSYIDLLTFGGDFPNSINHKDIENLSQVIVNIEKMRDAGSVVYENLMKIIRTRLTAIMLNPGTDPVRRKLEQELREKRQILGLEALDRIASLEIESDEILSKKHLLILSQDNILLTEFREYIDKLIQWLNQEGDTIGFRPDLSDIKNIVEQLDLYYRKAASMATIKAWENFQRDLEKEIKRRNGSREARRMKNRFGNKHLRHIKKEDFNGMRYSEIVLSIDELRELLLNVTDERNRQSITSRMLELCTLLSSVIPHIYLQKNRVQI